MHPLKLFTSVIPREVQSTGFITQRVTQKVKHHYLGNNPDVFKNDWNL